MARARAPDRRHDNPDHPVPRFARPPKVEKIWHNAFHEQLDEDPGVIEDTLAAMASVLSGRPIPRCCRRQPAQADLATSVMQAIQVSRRIGAKQLAIPLNPDAGGKLMMRREGQTPIRVGSLRLTVLGPTGPAPAASSAGSGRRGSTSNADDLQEIRENAGERRGSARATTTSDGFARTWLAPPRNSAIPAASRRPTSRR